LYNNRTNTAVKFRRNLIEEGRDGQEEKGQHSVRSLLGNLPWIDRGRGVARGHCQLVVHVAAGGGERNHGSGAGLRGLPSDHA
jgi:hypothetical protein